MSSLKPAMTAFTSYHKIDLEKLTAMTLVEGWTEFLDPFKKTWTYATEEEVRCTPKQLSGRVQMALELQNEEKEAAVRATRCGSCEWCDFIGVTNGLGCASYYDDCHCYGEN